jgi:hypothetical protein
MFWSPREGQTMLVYFFPKKTQFEKLIQYKLERDALESITLDHSLTFTIV